MLNDLINMTQGQLFMKYWWVWLLVTFLFAVFAYFDRDR